MRSLAHLWDLYKENGSLSSERPRMHCIGLYLELCLSKEQSSKQVHHDQVPIVTLYLHHCTVVTMGCHPYLLNKGIAWSLGISLV